MTNNDTSATAHRIDVHHHFVPPAVTQVMARRGINKVAGAPLPKWTPERSHGL